MNKEDADKIITLLSGVWNFCRSVEERQEIHRLAEVLRKASGQ